MRWQRKTPLIGQETRGQLHPTGRVCKRRRRTWSATTTTARSADTVAKEKSLLRHRRTLHLLL